MTTTNKASRLINILFILLLVTPFVSNSQNIDSLLVVLEEKMSKRNEYDLSKEERINSLKKLLEDPKASLENQYYIINRLIDEYEYYSFDATLGFIENNLKLANGETDENLEHFSIAKDQENLIPVLKQILDINPNIKIMGSPWSAPSWMKTNNNSVGGSLKPAYFATYANYFVKYIKAYKAEGITIDAITVQNEPQHDSNNPSMYMEPTDQALFIKDHLGPAFEAANIETKIIIWDHNANNPWYATSILEDVEANPYIDGSAFHLYAGSIDNLSIVRNLHPDKNLYFTEQWVGVNSEFEDNLLWHTRELIVGATRNWCKTVLEWNLVSNSSLEPHTPGGCTECLGGITIDGNDVQRNVGYYIVGHASKFVRPGSHRISSNYSTDLPNVAFKTPSGEIVVIVVNNTGINKSFNIKTPGESISTSLDAGSVGTYVW